MRETLLIAIILFILVLTPSTAFAQGMMGRCGEIDKKEFEEMKKDLR